MKQPVIEILLFAQAREAAGRERVTVAGALPVTAGALRERLARSYPELALLLGRSRLAVNRRIVRDDAPVARTDEVAVIPPVAGG
jgi:molybdopterin converting factor subunit 1